MSEHVTSGTVRDRSGVEALQPQRWCVPCEEKKKVDTLGLGYLTYEARDEGFPLQNEKPAASLCFFFFFLARCGVFFSSPKRIKLRRIR